MKQSIYKNGLLLVILFTAVLTACQKKSDQKDVIGDRKKEDTTKESLFQFLSPANTHITFNNIINENPQSNILYYQYFYNGGGVAVGDLNNDGLEDLYFSGNIAPNQLYLNRGKMEFEDISAVAGVAGRKNNWKTGVSMADVNGDGLLDIYLCYSGKLEGKNRQNQLFINQGLNDKGLPTFKDLAQEYGLADSAYSTHASFFDYDRDGDLDMFLLNHNPLLFRRIDEISIRETLKTPEPTMRAKLYRHDQKDDGAPFFTNVSDQAGFPNSAFSHGLGTGIADINNDGWPDIFVSNDYPTPDYLFINNQNGTFTDKLQTSMGHTSLYSMGNDIADINNDGLADIFELDMLPEDNRRQKLLSAPDNYEQFEIFLKVGFHYQYMRNMLHLNTGLNSEGAPIFAEVGQLADISNTDWSWAPLFADYDNDGWKDLFVSNGFLKDLTNLDFMKFSNSYISKFPGGNMKGEHIMSLLSKMPSTNVSNYIFKNKGNLSFSNQSVAWGISLPSNSNGAIYADLDKDGDLDLVTNNINRPAFVYENQTNNERPHHFLQLQLQGDGLNTSGIGAKVTLYANGKQQYLEQMPNRGYQSSVSPILHFGLGEDTEVDSLRIVWQSGKEEVLSNITIDQLLVLQEKNATSSFTRKKPVQAVFEEVKSPIAFDHQSTRINDFKRQPLLINPLSFSGPCMRKADVNGDGLEDVFIGGNAGQPAALFLQQKNGNFSPRAVPAFDADKESEDTDAVFFDANNDEVPDLYVSSGGYGNFMPNDPLLQDRLYLNDGNGNFIKSKNALPEMLSSSSCVRASDINGDGFQDLFVGGRVIPGRYPEPPNSYILINQGNSGSGPTFKDMTLSLAPQLQNPGMITDAAWYDLNEDGQEELIVVGEWMPIKVFSQRDGRLQDKTHSYFEKLYSGWWNKLLLEDFNGDGKADLVVGNMGENSQVKASESKAAELYFKDFDDNGSVDPILCFYIQGKSYPYVTRDELLDQLSMMRTRFPSYESYANASINEVFSPEEMREVGHLSANHLKTIYFAGGSGGKFTEMDLPIEAQFSPVFALNALDYNKDGKKDLLLCGNINEARLRFGKYDANYGILLEGNGKGAFSYVPQEQSGFLLKGDVRSILPLNDLLLFGINQQAIKAYKWK